MATPLASSPDRVIEGFCSFRKVVWMKELLPTELQEILKSQTAVAQDPLVELGGFPVRPC
jgi:hypothetical protein